MRDDIMLNLLAVRNGLPYVPSCKNCGATLAKDQLTQFRKDTEELLMEKSRSQGAQAIWDQLSRQI